MFNRFIGKDIPTMDSLMHSAKVRYTRPVPDPTGAANTIQNMLRNLVPNYRQVKPLKGSYSEAKQYYLNNDIHRFVAVMRYIETEVFYGRYTFE